MNIKPIRNLVHHKSVFELPKDKRSFSNRNHIAQELSNTMKKALSGVQKNELTLDKYKEILYQIIYPATPDIKFFETPMFKDYRGKLQTRVVDLDKDGQKYTVHMGYNMYLPMNKSGIITDKDVVIHESRHLFDKLCNPKYVVSRLSDLLLNEEKKEPTKNTLNYLVYTPFYNVPLFKDFEMNIYKKKAFKKLEQFTNAEKIRILQTARYQLLSELNAYSDIEVYSIKSVGSEIRQIDVLNLHNKIIFIEQELKKAIKKERALLSKQA